MSVASIAAWVSSHPPPDRRHHANLRFNFTGNEVCIRGNEDHEALENMMSRVRAAVPGIVCSVDFGLRDNDDWHHRCMWAFLDVELSHDATQRECEFAITSCVEELLRQREPLTVHRYWRPADRTMRIVWPGVVLTQNDLMQLWVTCRLRHPPVRVHGTNDWVADTSSPLVQHYGSADGLSHVGVDQGTFEPLDGSPMPLRPLYYVRPEDERAHRRVIVSTGTDLLAKHFETDAQALRAWRDAGVSDVSCVMTGDRVHAPGSKYSKNATVLVRPDSDEHKMIENVLKYHFPASDGLHCAFVDDRMTCIIMYPRVSRTTNCPACLSTHPERRTMMYIQCGTKSGKRVPSKYSLTMRCVKRYKPVLLPPATGMMIHSDIVRLWERKAKEVKTKQTHRRQEVIKGGVACGIDMVDVLKASLSQRSSETRMDVVEEVVMAAAKRRRLAQESVAPVPSLEPADAPHVPTPKPARYNYVRPVKLET